MPDASRQPTPGIPHSVHAPRTSAAAQNVAPAPARIRRNFIDAALRLVWPVILLQFLVSALLVIPGQGRDILVSALSSPDDIFRFLIVTFIFTLLVWLMTRTILGRNRATTKALDSTYRFTFSPWISVLFLFLVGISEWARSFYISIGGIAVPSIAFFWGVAISYALFLTIIFRRALRTFSRMVLIFSWVLAPILFIGAAFFPVSVSSAIGNATGAYSILYLGSLLIIVLLLLGISFLYNSTRPMLVGVGLTAALGVLLFFTRDDHQLRLIESETGGTDKLVGGHFFVTDLDAGLQQWQAANPQKKMILVAAAGGGIRAAYWTGLLLGKIQDDYPEFRDQLFAISGVSGGALGAAAFVAALDAAAPQCSEAERYKDNGPYERCMKIFLANDFLSPILASTFTGDLIRQFTGDQIWEWAHSWVPLMSPPIDRAAAIEAHGR